MHTTPYTPHQATPYARQRRTWRRLWVALLVATAILVVPLAFVSAWATVCAVGGGLYCAYVVRSA